MEKKITIREVASRAGVSIGTVDRVLNNRGNVSIEKEKAVREAVAALNYEPNVIAQSLARQKQKLKIGVTFPDVERHFWNQVKLGIDRAQAELSQLGVEVVVETTSSYNIEEQITALLRLRKKGVRGICMVPHHYRQLDETIDKLCHDQIPVVTFVSDSPESKRLFYMGIDDLKGGETAGKLMGLYLKGKGKIAIVAIHREVLSIDQRIDGFIQKIEREFPEIDILDIYDISGGTHLYDYENYQDDVSAITQSILAQFPDLDGIYVTNSLTNYVGKTIMALEQTDHITVIGHETTEDTELLLDQGAIDALICQNPEAEVYHSIKQLYTYLVNPTKDFKPEMTGTSSVLIKELL